ncbi:MAG: PIG-L deacetylase family protein [Acidimicrobiia bacterium]
MRVLAIGSHPDDVELGCGGALLRHVGQGDTVSILVMTTGQRGTVGDTSRVHEQQDAARVLGVRLLWGGFEDGSVPSSSDAITIIDRAVEESQADVMYTHAAADTHQDHRSTAIASQAAARRIGSVLCYETPSTQSFEPNVFVEIGDVLDAKLAALRAHWSQVLRMGPVDLDAISAQARFRGFQGRTRHAEAFESNRFVWNLGSRVETVRPAVAQLGIAR